MVSWNRSLETTGRMVQETYQKEERHLLDATSMMASTGPASTQRQIIAGQLHTSWSGITVQSRGVEEHPVSASLIQLIYNYPSSQNCPSYGMVLRFDRKGILFCRSQRTAPILKIQKHVLPENGWPETQLVYGLFILRKARSPLILNELQAFLGVNTQTRHTEYRKRFHNTRHKSSPTVFHMRLSKAGLVVRN